MRIIFFSSCICTRGRRCVWNVWRYENVRHRTSIKLFLLITKVISELIEDISLLIDPINDGKHEIIQPQILSLSKFIEAFKQFEEENNEKHSIQLVEENFQYLIDIAETSVLIINSKFVFSIQMPIMGKDTYNMHDFSDTLIL